MGVIKKFNPETGEWEVYGSTEASDINLLDVGDNFSDKNVEGALREISDKVSESLADLIAQKNTLIEHRNTLLEHASAIEWLKENGGGGGTGGGAVAPTITSTFENGTIVSKDENVQIPIFYASPNLGEGTAYVLIDNVEVAIITGIKQGNNVIDIGKLTSLKNNVSIYVKDRANMVSNQLTWTIIAGGIDLEVNFDATDYYITDKISMQFNVNSASTEPIIMHMTIDYDEYEIECNQGFNEYTYPELGVGIHNISFYLTSGPYETEVYRYNIVIVSSNTLYVSSMFENNSEFVLGQPVAVQYRISKASTESFNVKLYLNDVLNKELSCPVGTYYWTLNDLDIGTYKVRIEVSGAYDTAQFLEYNFTVAPSDYIPIRIIDTGLVYRLNAKSRTNQDLDRANPKDDSGNGVTATLHNFNWSTNGWIDGELVCDSNAYAEIDFKPWEGNAIFGSTIEVQYTALDIGLTNSRIFDYTDIETPFKGAYIDIEESTMKSLANTGQVTLEKDEEITVTFVIDRSNKFGKIFINGICSRAFSLSDSGSGVNATREDFTHSQKIYLNSKKGESNFGACKIKDVRIYNRVLTDDEIVSNYIAQISDLKEQEKMYNFNFNNTTLPVIRMYGDMTNMTLETPVNMRIKYTSPNEDLYGQSFDLPYCPVNWQGTSSLQYVLKNFTARLRDENMAVYEYTPYVNGIKEDVYCFKADYMESTHSRNVGIAKFVNDCLYDTKNPMQLQDSNIRNSITGFPCIMYINDELQGVYNFNLDRYSTKSFGYTDPDKCLVYEVSANSDTTAGAFYKWTEATGKDKLSYYKSDFECVYPPTRAAGNDNMTELIRLIEWVNDSSDEDFKDNFERYFNKEYVLRYYLFVLVFGAVDSLGKNMKLTSWDGLTWYPQVYDADTTIGLDNTGFLKFDMDIEMGDEGVFNTTGSMLWKRIVLLFQEELKQQYSLMRQDRFTAENIMKYLYDEQISQIPATYYNKDMQTKYLNYGSSYLYALHGNGENHIRKWIRERIMYVDTLLGYMTSSADYITLRSSKLGEVYLDIETYIPMYVSVKWRDEANNTGLQTKRVGRGETVRFTYNMPTATDQEILVYAGHYLKRLGNVSNLQPTSMLIANADRLTEIECHSSNLINTDLSECTYLQRIDLSDCTALGTGIGAQPILNIQKCKYLRYCDCRNTKLTAIYTMQSGGNLEEIYYPETTQVIQLSNQSYLRIAGIPFIDGKASQNLADVNITNCNNIEYISYPYIEGEELNLNVLKYIQNFVLINSLNQLKSLNFSGFNKLMTLEIGALSNLESLSFDNMLSILDTATLESVKITDCPLVEKITLNVTNDSYQTAFKEGTVIDLAGMHSLKAIESNSSIKGLNTLVLPLELKELIFTSEYGDGINDIINIWSSDSLHYSDGFKGIDFKNINLSKLDMQGLPKIENGLNFHLVLTDTNPNLNTHRDSSIYPYFKPEGSIDLTNYKGSMFNIFKGVDLSLLDIIIDKTQSQDNLSNVFEGAIIRSDQIDKINNMLFRYPNSINWSYMFKDADISIDPNELDIPDESSYREMNLEGMFFNSTIKNDITITNNIRNVSSMFENCKELIDYKENWNNAYDDIITEKCYFGTGGDLELVPPEWGGYGFFSDVTSEIVVRIPEEDYEVVVTNRYKLTNEYGIINWGDGTVDSLYENNYSHIYKEPGTYTIKGHFTFGRGYICNTSLNAVLLEVKQIASITEDLSQAFKYCSVLQKANLNNVKAKNLSEVFSNCRNLTEVICDSINTDELTVMSQMFTGCTNLVNIDLSHFNTSNVLTMNGLFNGCTKLVNINLDGFNTSKVLNMSSMFHGCKALQTLDLSGFDTKLVSDMSSMFYECNGLTELNVSNFSTTVVDTMTSMFYNCNKLTNLDLSSFRTVNVKSMMNMFYNCTSLTSIDLSGFVTDDATDLSSMFYNCTKLKSLDLSGFTTKKVETMSRMFYGCSQLTSLNVENFDTSVVTDMYSMFYGCKALAALNLSGFNTENVINMANMFSDCESLMELDLSSFDTGKVENMYSMFYDCNSLINLNISSFNTQNVTNMNTMFYECNNINDLNLAHFNTSKVTNMSSMFYNCNNLLSLIIDNFDTTNVTNMQSMFYGCNKLTTLDLSSFTTSNVTIMNGMFNRCEALTKLDLSNFNTEQITNMASLFYNCRALIDLDISSFNTESVKDMSYMFNNCSSLVELDLSHFVTPSLQNIASMFSGCSSLKGVDISNIITDNTTSMNNLFYNCINLLEIDLSNFNTGNVTNMAGMFNGCKSLTNLDINHFVTDKVTTMSSLFTGCSCDITFTNKNTTNVETFFAIFNVFNGKRIDLSGISLISSTNNDNFINVATSLTELIPPKDICENITITADNLSIESLLAIMDNLMEVSKPKVLKIGSKNLSKLTNEQLAIAINKNWTVA